MPEALHEPGKRRNARCEPQLDLHPRDPRALHETQQLDIMRLERGDHLGALDFHFERPIAELHADDGPFLFVQLTEQRRNLADQALLEYSRRAADRSASCG